MPKRPPKTRTVFVVHGRDLKLRDSVYAFLRSIGLTPLPFSVAARLTEQGAPYIGDVLNSAFDTAQAIVVLFTPEDEAKLRPPYIEAEDPPHERNLTPQARQNVIFEAGMAMGSYPSRTVLVEIGTLRPFSDIAGRHSIRLNNSSERRQELALRLREAGCKVNLTGSDWHAAGDFSLRKSVAKPRPTSSVRASRKLLEQGQPHRPWVTIDRYDAVYHEDEDTGEEYLIETLHAVNVGDESALSIRIAPITFMKRTAKLVEAPGVLRPAFEADLRIQNLRHVLEGIRDRIPRAPGTPRIVRLPLRVEYRDRGHRRWHTDHALEITIRGVTVSIAHPDESQEWTDVVALAAAPSPS